MTNYYNYFNNFYYGRKKSLITGKQIVFNVLRNTLFDFLTCHLKTQLVIIMETQSCTLNTKQFYTSENLYKTITVLFPSIAIAQFTE